ncbi:hypothetical protein [Flindersiella endophytica]
MANNPADIQIRTGALRDFAGASQLDIDVESIAQLPAEAGQGRSHPMMQEGTAFHQAHKQAAEVVVAQFEAIRQGHYGYRDGANRIGDTYVTNQHDVVQTQRAVDPFTTAPTTVPVDDRTLQA